MNKYRKITLVLILFFNCKNENTQFESFTSVGETKTSSYVFCTFVPAEVEYSYRVGKWIFKSSNKYKVAEGEYDIFVETVKGDGGCPYDFIKNSITLEKWKFWNEKGKLIQPTQKMINLISPNQMNSENPFDKN